LRILNAKFKAAVIKAKAGDQEAAAALPGMSQSMLALAETNVLRPYKNFS